MHDFGLLFRTKSTYYSRADAFLLSLAGYQDEAVARDKAQSMQAAVSAFEEMKQRAQLDFKTSITDSAQLSRENLEVSIASLDASLLRFPLPIKHEQYAVALPTDVIISRSRSMHSLLQYSEVPSLSSSERNATLGQAVGACATHLQGQSACCAARPLLRV